MIDKTPISNNWRTWPQVKFDIKLWSDVWKWLDISDPNIIIAFSNSIIFNIAIKDIKILELTLIKFNCELCCSEFKRQEMINFALKSVKINEIKHTKEIKFEWLDL